MNQARIKQRKGTVSLLLALAMMLMAMAAVTATTRTQMSLRRSQLERAGVARLDAAIQSATDSAIDTASPVRFPIDIETDHWIEIQTIDSPPALVGQSTPENSDSTWLKATEVRGERVLRSINRRIDKATP